MPRSEAAARPSARDPSRQKLERILGVRFKNAALLEEALTHKSYAVEMGGRIPFNERLEFLGDSVLSAAVAHYLFNRYPDVDEGKLSQLKSMLVSRPSLTVWGKDIGLGQFLKLSEGEHQAGGRDRNSIVGNAMEAVLGAMYLEAGFEPTQKFIDKLLSKRKRLVSSDHKSRLQEWAQKKYKVPPDYRVRRSFGPDHAKTFEVEVGVSGEFLGEGAGKSKKEAEQAAARDALRKVKDA
ncbi:MAG: ribonuclease III [Elusimicrobia bacterium RIFCSPLOWO2_01_FULL_59_12]|nr:MAG: ribonuclease III [Elusimicrobia bacterium RIFCSPLOWO2_01_FULL_59_12]